MLVFNSKLLFFRVYVVVMKISILRKIYPYLNSHQKNIKWRSLTDEEFERSLKDYQVIANCFEDATRYALIKSNKGRELLRKRFKIQKNASIDPAYKIQLSANDKKKEIYKATPLDYYGGYFKLYREYSDSPDGLASFDYSDSKLGLGVNIAVSKFVNKHPLMKPVLSRLYMFPAIVNRNCEYNKPSNAFKWFTGINPISIGENSINLNLRKNKKDVFDIFNKLGNLKSTDYSFVAVTGLRKIKDISSWHTVPINSVNLSDRTIEIINKRTNKITKISFDEFINNFKAIVGIKW